VWLGNSRGQDLKQENSTNQFALTSIGYRGKASVDDLAPLTKHIPEYTNVGDYVAIIGETTEPNAGTILQLSPKSATRLIGLTRVGPFQDTSPTLVFLQNGQTTDWLSEYKFSQRSLDNYEKIGKEKNFTIYKKKGCAKLGEMRLFFPVTPK
jgi:hypothetical protein